MSETTPPSTRPRRRGFGVRAAPRSSAPSPSTTTSSSTAPPRPWPSTAGFVQLGSPAAYLIPTGLFALLTTRLSEEAFLSWGWRVPFLLSIFVAPSACSSG
ncbi:hypothetical protein AB0C52_11900 [Streptomyces sp. NPDC048717]|uniref:hypothetical protein n=1 Tax=Streptomyces sp. NPDC048717 TaxID=3154928 RepID=UPI0034455935